MNSVGQLCAVFGVFGIVGLALVALPDFGGTRNVLAALAVFGCLAWVVNDGRFPSLARFRGRAKVETEERQD